ncbi:MAG: hypothetical protein K8F92_04675 [Hyphomicrobium sp.]|uniref:hypothetical protein n=1 Tax=Hyphomicrobium sp. TaxID=82 RepID=UPI001326CCBF|nr:hypothetical protein [Hyphomicrobium sp.]KAB2943609.1 MAG: hypothetical protein F9K20_02820 [Hyphomicrobium sp.]MBZ0208931.1 hypothetical protein [Hyphomicrobium sp.]
MKTIMTAAILVAGLFGVAGSAMADKTWNSDPSTHWPARTQSRTVDMAPAQVEPSYEPRKSYRLYRAPKARAKSRVKAR